MKLSGLRNTTNLRITSRELEPQLWQAPREQDRSGVTVKLAAATVLSFLVCLIILLH